MAIRKYLLLCLISVANLYSMDGTEGTLKVINAQPVDIKKEIGEFWRAINERFNVTNATDTLPVNAAETLPSPVASAENNTVVVRNLSAVPVEIRVANNVPTLETTLTKISADVEVKQPTIYWLSKEEALKYGIASAALVIAIGSVTYFFYKQGVLQKIGDSIKKYPYVSASMFSAVALSILALKLSAQDKKYLFGLTSGLALGCAAHVTKDLAKNFELI